MWHVNCSLQQTVYFKSAFELCFQAVPAEKTCGLHNNLASHEIK